MRTLVLAGLIKNHKTIAYAKRCAWCRRFESVSDYIAAYKHGKMVSHGICPACFKKQMAELDALDSAGSPPPEAA